MVSTICIPRACPHEAQAALPVVQLAQARADIALDAAIRQRVPVAGGKQVGAEVGVHACASDLQSGPRRSYVMVCVRPIRRIPPKVCARVSHPLARRRRHLLPG